MFPLYNGVGIHADTLYSPLAGNKRLKLEPHVQAALQTDQQGLIGFGSAYSNFLLSLALACHQAGLRATGIVCGEELADNQLNPVLSIAQACGMAFKFVSRGEYRQRQSPEYIHQLVLDNPGFSVVPEGGSTLAAATACGAMISCVREPAPETTLWLIAAGTGATSAGVAAAMLPVEQAWVVSVTNDASVSGQIRRWAQQILLGQGAQGAADSLAERLRISNASRPPRYARLDRELCWIINECHEQTGILLDPVYTVRVMREFVQLNARPANEIRPVLIHTGGLSGWLGQPESVNQWLDGAVTRAIEQLGDAYHQLPVVPADFR